MPLQPDTEEGSSGFEGWFLWNYWLMLDIIGMLQINFFSYKRKWEIWLAQPKPISSFLLISCNLSHWFFKSWCLLIRWIHIGASCPSICLFLSREISARTMPSCVGWCHWFRTSHCSFDVWHSSPVNMQTSLAYYTGIFFFLFFYFQFKLNRKSCKQLNLLCCLVHILVTS